MWELGMQERSWAGVLSDKGERSDIIGCLCLSKSVWPGQAWAEAPGKDQQRKASWDSRTLTCQVSWGRNSREEVKDASFAHCFPLQSTTTFMLFPRQKTVMALCCEIWLGRKKVIPYYGLHCSAHCYCQSSPSLGHLFSRCCQYFNGLYSFLCSNQRQVALKDSEKGSVGCPTQSGRGNLFCFQGNLSFGEFDGTGVRSDDGFQKISQQHRPGSVTPEPLWVNITHLGDTQKQWRWQLPFAHTGSAEHGSVSGCLVTRLWPGSAWGQFGLLLLHPGDFTSPCLSTPHCLSSFYLHSL